LKGNFSLVEQLSRGSGRRMRIMTGGNTGGIEDDDGIAGIEANANGGIPFSYSQAYGINAGSKNKALAWAFLKFLLTEEIQLSTALSPQGLPLNNRAREQKGELILSGAFMGGRGALDEGQREALGAYNAAVEALSDRIDCFVIQDTALNDMIAAEARYFFNGSRTAEETARALQNKADLYLHE
jgi:multiple sugar transport system substrate-binding protein